MILDASMAWYAQRSEYNYQPPPAWYSNCDASADEALAFVYPEQFEVVRRSRDFNGQLGSVILEAGHHLGEVPIFWYADENYLGTTTLNHRMEVKLEPGLHQLLIMDQDGNSAQASIKIVL